MRRITIAFLVVGLVSAVGCQRSGEIIWRAQADDGLVVTAGVPQRNYVRGDTVDIDVKVSNTSIRDIPIPADSGALVYATLWRRTTIGFEQVKRYPQTAVMVAAPWKLASGKKYKCTLNLPVEPDWPTSEPLKLTVELNGRDDVVAGGYVQIFATQADYDEALKD
ncbi:MAG: hypothetical protein SVV80_04550 [Planctomycetota bacterium]|nr:hypothetical protein [Planctomycetota bacterium]